MEDRGRARIPGWGLQGNEEREVRDGDWGAPECWIKELGCWWKDRRAAEGKLVGKSLGVWERVGKSLGATWGKVG